MANNEVKWNSSLTTHLKYSRYVYIRSNSLQATILNDLDCSQYVFFCFFFFWRHSSPRTYWSSRCLGRNSTAAQRLALTSPSKLLGGSFAVTCAMKLVGAWGRSRSMMISANAAYNKQTALNRRRSKAVERLMRSLLAFTMSLVSTTLSSCSSDTAIESKGTPAS